MNRALVRLVRKRAHDCCEYCRIRQSFSAAQFEIDHIIAQKHLGNTTSGNLAFACFTCNSAKGPNVAGIDPLTKQIVPLFHPRQQNWSDHFRWEGALIEGITPEGRATVDVLAINEPNRVKTRAMLITDGLLRKT